MMVRVLLRDLAAGMLDIRRCPRRRDELRPHTQTRHIRLLAAQIRQLQIQILLCVLEVSRQLSRALLADCIPRRAHRLAELKHAPRPRRVLLVLQRACEPELLVFRRGGGVVPGVGADVAVAVGAAVADPEDVPGVAVGVGVGGEGVVGGCEGPIDEGADAGREGGKAGADAEVPVGVRFED